MVTLLHPPSPDRAATGSKCALCGVCTRECAVPAHACHIVAVDFAENARHSVCNTVEPTPVSRSLIKERSAAGLPQNAGPQSEVLPERVAKYVFGRPRGSGSP